MQLFADGLATEIREREESSGSLRQSWRRPDNSPAVARGDREMGNQCGGIIQIRGNREMEKLWDGTI